MTNDPSTLTTTLNWTSSREATFCRCGQVISNMSHFWQSQLWPMWLSQRQHGLLRNSRTDGLCAGNISCLGKNWRFAWPCASDQEEWHVTAEAATDVAVDLHACHHTTTARCNCSHADTLASRHQIWMSHAPSCIGYKLSVLHTTSITSHLNVL